VHPCPNIMFLENLLSSSSVMYMQTVKYGKANIFAFFYVNMPKSCHKFRCKVRKVKKFTLRSSFFWRTVKRYAVCLFLYQSSTIKYYFGIVSLWIYNLNSKTHFNFAFITVIHLQKSMETCFKINGLGIEIIVKEQC
jgi:hypothetical protein